MPGDFRRSSRAFWRTLSRILSVNSRQSKYVLAAMLPLGLSKQSKAAQVILAQKRVVRQKVLRRIFFPFAVRSGPEKVDLLTIPAFKS